MERPPCAETCEWQVCNGIDSHHLYWPRKSYRTQIEKQFRNLGENVVKICRNEHDEIHATTLPPIKPDIETMRKAINERT